MSLFPLYDELAAEVEAEAISGVVSTPICDWSRLAPPISELPEEHRNVIFLLIYHHAQMYPVIKSRGKKSDPLAPYGERPMGGRGFIVKVSAMPVALAKIIGLYIARSTRQ